MICPAIVLIGLYSKKSTGILKRDWNFAIQKVFLSIAVPCVEQATISRHINIHQRLLKPLDLLR
jgi:hypothetical protein